MTIVGIVSLFMLVIILIKGINDYHNMVDAGYCDCISLINFLSFFYCILEMLTLSIIPVAFFITSYVIIKGGTK